MSTLWAVADPAVAAVIEQAHQAAVKDALAFIEKHALFTGPGHKASGRSTSEAWSPPRSPTATAGPATRTCTPTSRSPTRSRPSTDAGCPSTGGCCSKPTLPRRRPYNTALEQHLRETLGVRFAERPAPTRRSGRSGDRRRRPRLNQRWSTRRAHIEHPPRRTGHPIPDDHGRPPTLVEALHLAQQATLETRDAKHEPRSLTEQRATWLSEATARLGSAEAVASMVQTALALHAETAMIADSHWVAQRADHILSVMEASRSTWQMWHVRAEAQRQVRTIDVTAEQASALVDLLVDEVLDRRSVALAAPADGVEEPRLRRVLGLHRRRRRPLHLAADPRRRGPSRHARRDGAAVRPSSRWRSTWPCSKWRRTALHSMLGKRHWSEMCTSGHGCSSRSPQPAPGKPPPCAPWSWPGPKTAVRRRPGSVGCRGRRPRRANRDPHRHARQAHLVT